MQNGISIKSYPDALEFNDGFLLTADARKLCACAGHRRHLQRPKTPIIKRLITKSLMMMKMELNTTACVVERPTP